MAVVVDTDVVSFLYKQDDRGAFYPPYLANQLPIISLMTLAEMERWTLAANWGELKRQHLMKHLRRYTVYPVSALLCRKWAEVVDGARRRGRSIATSDAWIAASAMLLDVPLLTHNAGDFESEPGLNMISQT
ncbi:MAG TPA: PIN domain-containing protein [Pyrinomonadaceae bacterium]|nr:PIN domain-containing protein [Pyrinomonadaceae bacterium]